MGKIYLLGTGIYSSLQLTIETIQAIKVCNELFVLHDDPIVLDELKKLNSNITDCIDFYTTKGDVERHIIYEEIAETIINKAHGQNSTIGFILHGHPLFLVSASERILAKAEEKNILTITLPAVSSFDTLLVDLKLDFGYAVQMYDVNFFYSKNVIVNTNVPLILFQITTFQNPNLIRAEPKIDILQPLVERLLTIYPSNHEVSIIHSASHIFEKKSIIKSNLKRFFKIRQCRIMDKTDNLYPRNYLDDYFHPVLVSKIPWHFNYEKNIFNNTGFCHIPYFIAEEKIDEIILEVESLDLSYLKEKAAFEKNKEIKVIPYIDKVSDFFYDFTRHEYFKILSEFFLTKKTTPLFCEYFNKPKIEGSFSPPHQDQAYYNEHFSDEIAIAFWIALDDVNIKNGCLHYTSAYNDVLQPHFISNDVGFSKMIIESNLESYIPIYAKKGDCIIHHSLVAHFSGKNTSSQDRKAIVINYRTSSYRERNFK